MATKLPPPAADHARALCRSRLGSALRTALACSIVGASSFYAPPAVRHHIIRFPAFSYVVALLITADATLGCALRGGALAVYATVLGLLPAMLTAYLIRPEGMSAATASAAVAVSAFVVVVSDSAELLTKRIALGQIVLVYVAAFDFGKARMRPVLHPLPVAASTAVGAAAAVVALVVPYPRLACYEVRKKSKSYTETAACRLRLLLNAFCADSNSTCKGAFISQAKSLGSTCAKLLNSVRDLQGAMQWEMPPFKFLPPCVRPPSERLQAIETSLRGMEMALSSTTSSPLEALGDQLQLKDDILKLHTTMSLKIRGVTNSKSESDDAMDKAIRSLHDLPQTPQGLPSLFFLFCMKLLFDGTLTLAAAPPSPQEESTKVVPAAEHEAKSFKQEEDQGKENPNSTVAKKLRITMIQGMRAMNLSAKKVVIALKCSLSLGLAIFLGLLFSKGNGYWAGLAVAITFSPSDKSTFRLASVRAHGTAVGSVFGLLGSLASQNLTVARLLCLVPWVVFTGFLQRSRMYGQAGAICAVLSAMVILGRRDYGPPIAFSINRLTETYIGLCCSVLAEVLLQPTRASTLARGRLSESLRALRQCVGSLMNPGDSTKEREKALRKAVKEMKGYSSEAELEPSFWFLPFPVACYNKLHGSLARTGDILVFLAHGMEALAQECYEIEGGMREDMDMFKGVVGGLVRCLDEVIQVGSLERLGDCNAVDVEVGKGGQYGTNHEEGQWEEIVASFVGHSREMVERLDEDGVGELRSQLVLCFGAIGYCVGALMGEVREMEEGVLELVQWENPSSYINLHEIFCRIKELASSC